MNPGSRETCYSVVVPVYNNEGSLTLVLDELAGLDAELGGALEAVFVVDGGRDRSAEVLARELPRQRYRSTLVQHSRNFGSFAAIRTGLSQARGPFFAVMAADRQEPIELIGQMFRALRDEPIDVVLGVRAHRADPWLSRFFSNIYWALYRKLIQRDMPKGGVDIFGCNLAVRDQIGRLGESNSSLVGLVVWVGGRRKLIPYDRRLRESGRSGWTFSRKVRYLADSVFTFSDLPIRLLLWMGALGIMVIAVVAVIVLSFWAAGRITVPGYAALMLAILFTGALVTFALGVVGSYVWRTFENTKGRPQSIVLAVTRFAPGDPQ